MLTANLPMSDNTKIVKNSIVLYIRLAITTALGLFTSRLILKNLGASDFGLYSVVGGVVVILSVLNMAIASSSYRFIAFEMGKGDLSAVNKVFNISLTLHICLAFIIFLLAETVGLFYVYHYLNVPEGKLDDAVFVFHFSVAATVINIFGIPFQSLITATEKFAVRATIEVISAVLRFCIAFFLVYCLGNRLRLYSVLTGMMWTVTAVMFISYCRWKYLDIVQWKFQKDAAKYREMTSFSGWTLLGALAMVGWSQGAAIVLNLFFGTIINAAFGVAKQVSDLITTFTHTLGTVSVPQIHKTYSVGNIDRTMQIVYHISKYTFFLMLLPSLPALLETDYLLSIWLGDVPEYTVIFCQLTILAALVQSLKGSASTVIQSTGNIKYFEITMSAIYLLSLPIGYLFLKSGFPPYSIMIVYISAESINLIILMLTLKKLVNFDILKFAKFVYLKIFYVISLISPLFIIKNMCTEGLVRFAVMSVAAVIWLLIAVYLVGIDKNERQVIRYRVSKILLKF